MQQFRSVFWDILRSMGCFSQKGQAVAITVLLIPVIIGMMGLAIDIGNIYVHQSRLQNAVDSSVIGGGWAYVNNDEKVDNHPKADETTDKFMQQNHDNYTNLRLRYVAREGDDKNIYYRVEASETVDLFLLRYFDAIGDTSNVRAVACVRIKKVVSSGGTKNVFNNLFSFGEGGFHSVNANQNPDNPRIAQTNQSAVYDGNLVGNGKNMNKDYRHELMNSESLKYRTVQEAIDAGAYSTLESNPDMDIYEPLDRLMALKDDHDRAMYAPDQNISGNGSINQMVNQGKDVMYYDFNNCSIRLDKSFEGGKDKPIYIILDNNWCNINLNLDTNMSENSRPYVIVYRGQGDINFNGNYGKTFRGVIYAPNARIFTNNNNMNYYGSMVAKTIQLQSKAYYHYENYIGDGGAPATDDDDIVKLVLTDVQGVNWN